MFPNQQLALFPRTQVFGGRYLHTHHTWFLRGTTLKCTNCEERHEIPAQHATCPEHQCPRVYRDGFLACLRCQGRKAR